MKGNPQKGWARKHTCTGDGNGGGGCSSLLLVEQKDVFRTAHHSHDGSSEYYNTFICPVCGVATDIPSVPFTPREMTDEEKGIVQR